jgi:hypothetical protein
VSDINVQEMPIEDVIRQLFGERRAREPAVPSLAASGDEQSGRQ